MTLDDLLSVPPADHEEGRRLAWLREKLGIATPGAIRTLTPPVLTFACTSAELATWRAAELPHLVAVVLNRFRAHGGSDEVCDAFAPSLTVALGAWWDQHFTHAEEAAEKGDDAAD